MNSIDQLRLTFSYAIISTLWINVALVASRTLYAGDIGYTSLIGALVVSLSATFTWAQDKTGVATRVVTSIAATVTVILLVYSFQGHAYQVDLHMYFFAVLAMSTGWCDWRALLGSASTTALHHIVLNFLLPAVIYPGGPDVFRLAIHAGILISELAVLIWIAEQMRSMFAGADSSLRSALENNKRIEALVAETHQMKLEESAQYAQRETEIHRFIDRMGEVSTNFAKTSHELEVAANALSATAEETSRQAQSSAGTASSASANVRSVATSTDGISDAMRSIAQQVSRSGEVANIAANEAASTETTVRALSESANKIGEVVDLINSIASQTNLLALNATIEAARAGEAGRGFAVVASEVKQLASQTAKATEEIGAKIAEIQSATSQTVSSIEKIVGTVAQIQQISSAIAEAIASQNAAIYDISANTQLAADGTEFVSSTIKDVGQAAEQTGVASSQLMGLSQNLSAQSTGLKQEVADFVKGLRVR